MTPPVITTPHEIGANRPLCSRTIHVAEGTTAARRGAYQRQLKGLPVNACGARADFLFDGAPLCRAHAGQEAIQVLMEMAR
jgi:hypothetical protein